MSLTFLNFIYFFKRRALCEDWRKCLYSNFKSKIFEFVFYLWIIYSKKQLSYLIFKADLKGLFDGQSVSQTPFLHEITFYCLNLWTRSCLAVSNYFFYRKVKVKFSNFSIQWKYREYKTTAAQLIHKIAHMYTYACLAKQWLLYVCPSAAHTLFIILGHGVKVSSSHGHAVRQLIVCPL